MHRGRLLVDTRKTLRKMAQDKLTKQLMKEAADILAEKKYQEIEILLILQLFTFLLYLQIIKKRNILTYQNNYVN